jgi:hypothetical protein
MEPRLVDGEAYCDPDCWVYNRFFADGTKMCRYMHDDAPCLPYYRSALDAKEEECARYREAAKAMAQEIRDLHADRGEFTPPETAADILAEYIGGDSDD